MTTLPVIAIAAAEAARRRQQGQARPAYRNRYLGRSHTRAEAQARRLLHEARGGAWQAFYAPSAEDASALDQCARYIVRQERPAESVRVEWLRRDGSWRAGFPRPVDRRGHGELARIRREAREAIAGLYGRSGGTFDAQQLARMERVQSSDGEWWYAGRLQLGPKRGTAAPAPERRATRPLPEMLGRALIGGDS